MKDDEASALRRKASTLALPDDPGREGNGNQQSLLRKQIGEGAEQQKERDLN